VSPLRAPRAPGPTGAFGEIRAHAADMAMACSSTDAAGRTDARWVLTRRSGALCRRARPAADRGARGGGEHRAGPMRCLHRACGRGSRPSPPGGRRPPPHSRRGVAIFARLCGAEAFRQVWVDRLNTYPHHMPEPVAEPVAESSAEPGRCIRS
jgi:hypothetical protein